MSEILVDPLPDGAKKDGALYPDGAHITDLATVRGLLYKMQRPAIAPKVTSYCHLYVLPIADFRIYHVVGVSP